MNYNKTYESYVSHERRPRRARVRVASVLHAWHVPCATKATVHLLQVFVPTRVLPGLHCAVDVDFGHHCNRQLSCPQGSVFQTTCGPTGCEGAKCSLCTSVILALLSPLVKNRCAHARCIQISQTVWQAVRRTSWSFFTCFFLSAADGAGELQRDL